MKTIAIIRVKNISIDFSNISVKAVRSLKHALHDALSELGRAGGALFFVTFKNLQFRGLCMVNMGSGFIGVLREYGETP